jgi:hypothetical protein
MTAAAYPKRGRVARLLTAYTFQAYPILREYMRADGCIAATRVTLDVFRHFGVRGYPQVVQLDVFNPAFRLLTNKLGRMPTEEEARAHDDIWLVTVGFPRDNELDSLVGFLAGRWHGHLVALLRLGRRHVLVDASLKQAERPEKGIALPDILTLTVPASFPQGEPYAIHDVERGCILGYRPRQEYDPYDSAPDWRSGVYSELTRRLIRLLEQEVT